MPTRPLTCQAPADQPPLREPSLLKTSHLALPFTLGLWQVGPSRARGQAAHSAGKAGAGAGSPSRRPPPAGDTALWCPAQGQDITGPCLKPAKTEPHAKEASKGSAGNSAHLPRAQTASFAHAPLRLPSPFCESQFLLMNHKGGVALKGVSRLTV